MQREVGLEVSTRCTRSSAVSFLADSRGTDEAVEVSLLIIICTLSMDINGSPSERLVDILQS
jgi:hypothetical protein